MRPVCVCVWCACVCASCQLDLAAGSPDVYRAAAVFKFPTTNVCDRRLVEGGEEGGNQLV